MIKYSKFRINFLIMLINKIIKPHILKKIFKTAYFHDSIIFLVNTDNLFKDCIQCFLFLLIINIFKFNMHKTASSQRKIKNF